MSEPPISLRDVKKRKRKVNFSYAGTPCVYLTVSERDALVEAVEADLKLPLCPHCASVPYQLHNRNCPLARFSFDTGAGT